MPPNANVQNTNAVLVADIGGTNTRFALASASAAGSSLQAVLHYQNDEAQNFEQLLERYLQHCRQEGVRLPIRHACFAVAAAVESDRARLTNRNWTLDARELEHRFSLEQVALINDFHALASSVITLGADGLRELRHGTAVAGAPLCVLGPGTGLGVAMVINPGPLQTVIATEGGHVDFAATDEASWSLRQFVAQQQDRKKTGGITGGTADAAADAGSSAALAGAVSAEHVLCGQGLALIDAFVRGAGEPQRTPAQVSAAALSGEAEALRTVLWYLELLGGFAGDAALTHGARGGVFVGGGVVPRIAGLMAQSQFNARFVQKGAMRAYAAAISVHLIVDPQAALNGAARHLWQQTAAQ